MSDINLTPEQWRMARQAGALFTDDTPGAVQTPYGDQLILPGLGPVAGDQYRNIHTGEIATVIKLRRGRRQWVTLRRSGHDTEIPVDWLAEHYRPFRAGGAGL